MKLETILIFCILIIDFFLVMNPFINILERHVKLIFQAQKN